MNNPQENPPREENKDMPKGIVLPKVNENLKLTQNFDTYFNEDNEKRLSLEDQAKELAHSTKDAIYSKKDIDDLKTAYAYPPKIEKSKGSLKSKVVAALGALSMLFPNSAKSEKTDTDKNAEKHTSSINKDAARKVSQEPEGYKKIGTENGKTYFLKTWEGELSAAKASDKKGGKEYEEKMIGIIKQGKATPTELAKLGYISQERVPEFNQYLDLVYTETTPENVAEKKEDPFAAFGGRKESIFNANKHIAGEIRYATALSTDVKDGGVLNTAEITSVFIPRDDFAIHYDKAVYLTAQQHQQLFGTTNTFQSAESVRLLEEIAAKQKMSNPSLQDMVKNK